MSKPLVSIILPVYNAQNHIARCLESICAQSWQNIEVIVLNDGSKDQSLPVCEAFRAKDERIVLVDKANSGVSDTRNLGLKLASGKYVQFVDSDDYIDPDFTEHLVTAAEQNNAGCSVRADILDHAFDSAIKKHDFALCYIVKPVNDIYAVADGECKADLLVAVIKSETGNILAQ